MSLLVQRSLFQKYNNVADSGDETIHNYEGCWKGTERDLQLKLYIDDRIIQYFYPLRKSAESEKDQNRRWTLVAINNEFANTRKLKKTFLQSLQLLRQISPFSKDKTFLS